MTDNEILSRLLALNLERAERSLPVEKVSSGRAKSAQK
jgi:hypothetical protein